MKTTTDQKTILDVVEGGYCVGCGACAYAGNLKMSLNIYGEYKPLIEKTSSIEHLNNISSACPFLNETWNEDRLSEHFLKDNEKWSDKLGLFQHLYAGHVLEDRFREQGTSGGFGTWIGVEMLRKKMIDGIIHVREQTRKQRKEVFSTYSISWTEQDARDASRTKYHVVEFSQVLSEIKANPGKRYLFVGLPCMIKAIRRLQLNDPVLKSCIAYTMALVCGHLKSMHWSLSLGWSAGIHPKDLDRIRYRTKGERIPARSYVISAFSGDIRVSKDTSKIVGGKFNQGAMMLKACDFCDDVVGETADITVGDAWLPRFEIDRHGNNMLIVRNPDISSMLSTALIEERVWFTPLTEKEAVDAQAGGFRQRREGLALRIADCKKNRVWHPAKRTFANTSLPSPLRKMIYRRRSRIATISHSLFVRALESDNFEIYEKGMKIPLLHLRILEILSSFPRILRKFAFSFLLKLKMSLENKGLTNR